MRIERKRGAKIVRRYGWKNKSQSREKTGFYEVVCPICGSKNRFIIEPKTIPFHNYSLVKKILISRYYMARSVGKQ